MNNQKKSPTAIVCLSPNLGGLELDAIKYTNKLSCLAETILICKKDSLLARKAKHEYHFTVVEISFQFNVSFSLFYFFKKAIKKYSIRNIVYFGASELKSMFFSVRNLDTNFIIRHGTRKRPKKNWYHSKIYSIVDYHIGISKDLTNNITTGIPIGGKTKVRTIYPSVKYLHKPKQSKTTDNIQILNTGRIAEGKGHIDMIDACDILYRNDINFTLNIVGTGDSEYVDKIMKYSKSKIYSKNIIFHGFKEKISNFLESNDIFLFPSYGEGLSNSFTEALCHGLVCLSYDNTSFCEFKELGFYTHLVDNLDKHSLSQKLLKIVKSIEIEKKKSFCNIEHALNIFSEDDELENYSKLLI